MCATGRGAGPRRRGCPPPPHEAGPNTGAAGHRPVFAKHVVPSRGAPETSAAPPLQMLHCRLPSAGRVSAATQSACFAHSAAHRSSAKSPAHTICAADPTAHCWFGPTTRNPGTADRTRPNTKQCSTICREGAVPLWPYQPVSSYPPKFSIPPNLVSPQI